jgi:SHS2 domain-containing protein
MKKYEILEHKADLKIRAFGKTKEELFLNMLKGMISGLRPEILNSEAETQNIEIKSPDLEALLVDFLSEVLYLTQVNKEIYADIKFKKLTDPSTGSGQVAELEGELTGQKVERFGEDIKAVTYHDLDIHQKADGTWEVTVLFDI